MFTHRLAAGRALELFAHAAVVGVQSSISENDAHRMRPAVVGDRDGTRVRWGPVQHGLGDARAASLRIEDGNLVARGADSPRDHVLAPRRRNARVDLEERATT